MPIGPKWTVTRGVRFFVIDPALHVITQKLNPYPSCGSSNRTPAWRPMLALRTFEPMVDGDELIGDGLSPTLAPSSSYCYCH
ncbi:hypothetical protein Pcac1_g2179 [Phytophthora cactorum]|nr:hypothetical protein Pcac1_g2179 [Phytophthora cactorum]